MTAALLVTADETLRSRMLGELRDCSVFTAHGADDALRVLRMTETDLVILDVLPPTQGWAHFLARARELSSSAAVVCLYPSNGLTPEDWKILERGDFLLQKPFTSHGLALVLRQAAEKQRLLLEVSALRARQSVAARPISEGSPAVSELASPSVASVLKEFAKSHSAGFDLSRVLELFLDAVGEMVKSSRAALLLANPTGRDFCIAAHQGLARHLVKSVRLAADHGLPLWFELHGRPIYAAEVQAQAQEPLSGEVARELGTLQAVVAVPLLAHGEVVAILTLGQRITGTPYSPRETEVLFSLATHVAMTIRDIQRHHQLQYQKVYIEQILSHMSSGLITIDRQERVIIMNRRAEETLRLSANEVLNRDLRVLPSPLGDLLYESLRTGRTVHRIEIQLAHPKLPLEVSSYPIAGNDPSPLGAVLLFEDLSAAKLLAAEKRQRELFELFTRVMARMADEIKSPLVSVHTFMELLDERIEEPEFRQRFAKVVGQDVRRLVEIVEKISALVSERELKFEVIDVCEVVEGSLAEFGAQAGPRAADGRRILHFTDAGSGKRAAVSLSVEGDGLAIKGDRSQLKKAITYLLWYLIRKSPGEETQLSISIGRSGAAEGSVQLLVSSPSAKLKGDELQRIFDPLQAVQESLIDVGPFVSQRIIEAHQGRLSANQGRREVSFPIELPLAPA